MIFGYSEPEENLTLINFYYTKYNINNLSTTLKSKGPTQSNYQKLGFSQ